MTQPVYDAVRTTITVGVSQQRAFEVFTAQFGTWWPREYSIGEADMADFVVEPKVGGRWYEVGVDGTECDTGRVTAFEPPERLVLAWHLNESFQYDPDPAHASEVEIRFIAEDSTQTRVELEHRDFERHGVGAQAVHDGVNQGWSYCLELYAKHTAA
ncbi:MAG: SRPBCC family protein [Acidimicrobiales bacterium]